MALRVFLVAVVRLATLHHTSAQRIGCMRPDFSTDPSDYPEIRALPNPFISPVLNKSIPYSYMGCQKLQVQKLVQDLEYGAIPEKPASVRATIRGFTIEVSVTDNNKTVGFNATLSLPSRGYSPFPVNIALGRNLLPEFAGLGTLVLDVNQISAAAGSPTEKRGIFYDLYGPDHSASGIAAWAWAVSRLIDAIEILGTARTSLDPTRIAVSGCSDFGTGAIAAGAFDERVDLTIPIASSSAGHQCWRPTVDAQVQVGERPEGGPTPVFAAFVEESVNRLPFDQHQVLGLIPPNAIFIIDANDDADAAGQVCALAAKRIFDAWEYGEHIGYRRSAVGGTCTLAAEDVAALRPWLQRFLFKDWIVEAPADAFPLEPSEEMGRWINWDVGDCWDCPIESVLGQPGRGGRP